MLLIDAANVIGSRPDGWWKDRAGAARRLVVAVQEAVAGDRLRPPVVVVLEGRARSAAAEHHSGGVRVAHAPRSGDDEVVRLAGEAADGAPVMVVTADRGLRQRVEATGAEVVGPSWLLARTGS